MNSFNLSNHSALKKKHLQNKLKVIPLASLGQDKNMYLLSPYKKKKT